ncbi:MAG: serine/threonine protein kinase [Acidobacteriota bacterium]|nr:MAG: serine/threonine protein kinase [Acidobacteriota bacterium]
MGFEGKKFGRYKVMRLLGEGAMGGVFEARDPVIGRTVALKVIRPELLASEEHRARFFREAQAAGKLSHPHIVTLYDMGKDTATGANFLSMEHLPGGSLRDRMKKGKPMPAEEAASYAASLLEALEHAHEHGIVHRDVKPENLLFSSKGTLKLADFGIARPEASHLTQTGEILGTPYYMAPEQILGKPTDGRADLFAAGVILYEMLSGRKPFEGENIPSIAHAICYDEPPPLHATAPDVPEALSSTVTRLLEKNPKKRFAKASKARQALLASPSSKKPSRKPSKRKAQAGVVKRRLLRMLPWGAALLAGLALFGAAGYLTWKGAQKVVQAVSSTDEGMASRAEEAPPAKKPLAEKKKSAADGWFSLGVGKSETVRFELVHYLSDGELALYIDGDLVFRKSFEGSKKFGVPQRSVVAEDFKVKPGKHSIRVRIEGGKRYSETTMETEVRKNETRTLRAYLSRLKFELTLYWE